jgi:hypothetical protein
MSLPGTAVRLALGMLVLALAGCGESLDASYGRSRGKSLNGTAALAALVRHEGYEVKTAFRLTDELKQWADAIVRFAPRPGPVASAEADWYNNWLDEERSRRLVYVPRDYDAQADYWAAVLAHLPKTAPADERERAGKLRDEAKNWPDHLPPAAKKAAGPESWFAVEIPAVKAATVCKTLGGPWAQGVDAAAAALPRHQTLKVDSETVLLSGDGKTLAMSWTRYNEGRVLVLASGAFVVNAALANPERRRLARRVVDWLGEDAPGGRKHVAFVEGGDLFGEGPLERSGLDLLWVFPFGWITAQMLAVGLAACLAAGVRLGRPRSDPPSGQDRPVAHPTALGALLARTGRRDVARAQLETFRQWRRGHSRPPGAGAEGSSPAPP